MMPIQIPDDVFLTTEPGPDVSPRLQEIIHHLGLKHEDIERFSRWYNSNMESYDNAVYRVLESRVTHYVNFYKQSWFAKRLNPIGSAHRYYDLVVDLGFSLPYPYFFSTALHDSSTKYLFVDNQDSALNFYGCYQKHFAPHRLACGDIALNADIEKSAGQKSILKAFKKTKAQSPIIVASEIIEHLQNPEGIWSFYERFSRNSEAREVHFYITLPIGTKIPSHTVEFLEAADARNFVQPHLSIIAETVLTPPPKQWRTFARGCYCVLGKLKPVR